MSDIAAVHGPPGPVSPTGTLALLKSEGRVLMTTISVDKAELVIQN